MYDNNQYLNRLLSLMQITYGKFHKKIVLQCGFLALGVFQSSMLSQSYTHYPFICTSHNTSVFCWRTCANFADEFLIDIVFNHIIRKRVVFVYYSAGCWELMVFDTILLHGQCRFVGTHRRWHTHIIIVCLCVCTCVRACVCCILCKSSDVKLGTTLLTCEMDLRTCSDGFTRTPT